MKYILISIMIIGLTIAAELSGYVYNDDGQIITDPDSAILYVYSDCGDTVIRDTTQYVKTGACWRWTIPTLYDTCGLTAYWEFREASEADTQYWSAIWYDYRIFRADTNQWRDSIYVNGGYIDNALRVDSLMWDNSPIIYKMPAYFFDALDSAGWARLDSIISRGNTTWALNDTNQWRADIMLRADTIACRADTNIAWAANDTNNWRSDTSWLKLHYADFKADTNIAWAANDTNNWRDDIMLRSDTIACQADTNTAWALNDTNQWRADIMLRADTIACRADTNIAWAANDTNQWRDSIYVNGGIIDTCKTGDWASANYYTSTRATYIDRLDAYLSTRATSTEATNIYNEVINLDGWNPSTDSVLVKQYPDDDSVYIYAAQYDTLTIRLNAILDSCHALRNGDLPVYLIDSLQLIYWTQIESLFAALHDSGSWAAIGDSDTIAYVSRCGLVDTVRYVDTVHYTWYIDSLGTGITIVMSPLCAYTTPGYITGVISGQSNNPIGIFFKNDQIFYVSVRDSASGDSIDVASATGVFSVRKYESSDSLIFQDSLAVNDSVFGEMYFVLTRDEIDFQPGNYEADITIMLAPTILFPLGQRITIWRGTFTVQWNIHH